LESDREGLIQFLNNLTLKQVHILFNASNEIRVEHFEDNIKHLKDKKFDIFESLLSQEEFDIFFNGKLGERAVCTIYCLSCILWTLCTVIKN
jgi:hypothetical protein